MRVFRTSTVLGTLVLSIAAAAHAQTPSTVDVIIEKNLAAHGGREALQKLTSQRMTATVTYPTPKGDMTGTMEVLAQAPNKSYSVMHMDMTVLGRGTDVVEEWFDGTSGHTRDKVNGTIPISGSRLESLRNQVFPSDLLVYKARGTKIYYAGQETVGGRHAFVLVLRYAVGPAEKRWIDTTTYLQIRTSVTRSLPRLGEVEDTADYSDFRVVDGVKLPFVTKGITGAQSWTSVVTKLEHNVPIDPKVFVKPAGK